MSTPLWEPSSDRVARANLTAFAARVTAKHGVVLPDYTALFRWSTDEPEAFWREVWNDAGIVGDSGGRTLVDAGKMPGARWFPDARLNFAENLLEGRSLDGTGDAFVFWGEDKVQRRVSNAELVATVSRVAQGLRAAGYEVLNEVSLNQVLVSFGEPGLTERVIAALQEDGTCWCAGTVWQGRTAMRISVSSWATRDADVEASLDAMIRMARSETARR